MFGKREIARTCKRCGHLRYVPKRDQFKRPEGNFMAACSRQTRGASGTLDSYNQEQQYRRQLVSCPQCNSTSFKDRPA